MKVLFVNIKSKDQVRSNASQVVKHEIVLSERYNEALEYFCTQDLKVDCCEMFTENLWDLPLLGCGSCLKVR